MKILVVEAFTIVREGIVKILSGVFQNAKINGCSNYSEAIASINKNSCEIVILDINLPGRNGLELLSEIKSKSPEIAVIVLSIYREELFAVRAIKSGASSYLSKNEPSTELIKAIKTVYSGEMYITDKVAKLLALEVRSSTTKLPHELLTDREFWVFRLIASGKSVSTIAAELLLSVKTISAHRANILRKMKLKDNSELMHYAYNNRIIDMDLIP